MVTQKRAENELRPVRFELDYILHPEGSVLISMGDTKVLCNATVEERLPRWLHRSSRRHGWVTAEYAMLPRSTHQRVDRETLRPKGRTQEITRADWPQPAGGGGPGQAGRAPDRGRLRCDPGGRGNAHGGDHGWLRGAGAGDQAAGAQEEGETGHADPPGGGGECGHFSTGKRFSTSITRWTRTRNVDFNVVMTDSGEFVEAQGTAEGEPFSKAASTR